PPHVTLSLSFVSNVTATTPPYPLSLHDALPIFGHARFLPPRVSRVDRHDWDRDLAIQSFTSIRHPRGQARRQEHDLPSTCQGQASRGVRAANGMTKQPQRTIGSA